MIIILVMCVILLSLITNSTLSLYQCIIQYIAHNIDFAVILGTKNQNSTAVIL